MEARIFTLLSLIVTMALLVPGGARPSTAQSQRASPAAQEPVMFIENVGQFADGARFQVRGGSDTMWLADDAMWITVVERSHVDMLERFNVKRKDEARRAVNLKLTFPGANPHPRIEPFDRLETVVSYFIGNDPAKWRRNVPVWRGVRYVDLYPGVDLVVGASLVPAPGQSQGLLLPWQLEVSDGADLSTVRLRVEGADALALYGDSLCLTTTVGEFRFPLPALAGKEEDRATGNPVVVGNVVFHPFSPSLHLLRASAPRHPAQTTVDSDLLYSTFLGGSSSDWGGAIAVDESGAAYVTGLTYSSDFPTTTGAFDTTHNGDYDAFVVKLNAAGSGLVYASFLGGTSGDDGYAITVDGSGAAYVTGETASSNFPTTAGAFDATYNGGTDAFVAKFDTAGSGLAYSTFLGGGGSDYGHAIAVDGSGAAYVAGETASSNFPATAGAFDTTHNGGIDAFVTKLNAAGSTLVYSTFLGGIGWDYNSAIAVDWGGAAYIAGETTSSNFPTTSGAFDTTYNGGSDAFVTKLNAAGSALVYSTFLGGSDRDEGHAITVDGAGAAYITGGTESSNFPTTPGAFDTTHNGGIDAFVVKLDTAGSRLVYATFLGGSDWDEGRTLAIDGGGAAYVTGLTCSYDFPITTGAFDTTLNGYDAFVLSWASPTAPTPTPTQTSTPTPTATSTPVIPPPALSNRRILDIGENHFNNKKIGRLSTVWRRAKMTRARGRFEPRCFTRWQAIGD